MTRAQADTLKAYDAIAPVYAEYSARYRDYLDAVDRLVIDRLTPGMRLLDLGSGDGRRLRKIASASGLVDVVSVEPSPQMAALCRSCTGFPVHELFGDNLDALQDGGFDAITALWNVFGHMADSSVRVKALSNLRAKLAPGGRLLLDVNNRHNRAYGKWRTLGRRVIDYVTFDERRGDAHYEWTIAGKCFPASGHLFIPAEMDKLFLASGLRAVERLSVDYRTGEVSTSPFMGQLFFRLEAA